MEKEGNLEKDIDRTAENFFEKTENKEILVVSHFDTDGITSAAIMIRTLKKLDKKFSVKIVKNLEREFILELPKDKTIIFLDLASNSLNHIIEAGLKDLFIIDHHEIIQQIPENVNILNAENYNLSISSSGMTYLFCKKIYPEIKEYAKLAVLGMIGDCLEKNLDKTGNQFLIDGEVTKKRGLLIYPSTRPLSKVLEFSSDPFIPGVTGDTKGVNDLLREVGLNENGKCKSLIELNEEEMSKLVTSIYLRKPKSNYNETIIGDIFLIKFFNKLEDARELSAMINACSRLGESNIAIQFCLEFPKSKKRVETLYIKYKRFLISGLDFATKSEKIEGKGYVIINAKDEIKDTIIGTIASILSNSFVYEEGTMIVTMAYNHEKIKVSSRSVGKNGRNVREVLNNVVVKIGGEVGGHKYAAGCIIEKTKENEFIDNLKKALEIELVKIN